MSWTRSGTRSECLQYCVRWINGQVLSSVHFPIQHIAEQPGSLITRISVRSAWKRHQHAFASRPVLYMTSREPRRAGRTPHALALQGRTYAAAAARDNATSPKVARLEHRRLLAVHGQDAARFLQGLTTSNVPTTWASSSRDGFYSTFLNAQGRLLHDVFIYPATASKFYQDTILPERIKGQKSHDDLGFVIEADAAGIETLAKHLRRHKLRAKVDIWLLDPAEASLMAVFGSNVRISRGEELLRSLDNRAPGFGTRVIMAPSSPQGKLLTEQFSPITLPEYHRARHMIGIAEGQASTGGEMPYGASLPHEMNVDLMGGVDFRKGCYVGQELTIRTQHKGVVRKRVVPVSLYSISGTGSGDLVKTVQGWVDSGAAVDIVPKGRKGRPAGRWIVGVPSEKLDSASTEEVGLAMCRLEMMTDLIVEAGGDGGGVRFKEGDEFVLRPKWEDGRKEDDTNIGIKAHVPAWIRDGIESRTRRDGQDRAVDGDGGLAQATG